ncbi:MAG TPA: nitroreductase/quinone reductase family protein, partial [Asanoa sp.]|nr:nitroreductase/quinone reductase family protein [Asanoa sp.]
MNEKRRHLNPYERAMESFARTGAGTWYLKQIAPRIDPPLLRFTGGRVSSVYPTPVMLLTTTGAKSGQPRTLPLVYVTDREQLILMASNYGWPSPRCRQT